MEYFSNLSIWTGLLTLILLEIILGIDNLVFIAILTDKLPQKQHDKARQIALSLALIMRIVLLSIISWMVSFTQSLFMIYNFSFSGKDLILLIGGLFLLFKATTELHERLENIDFKNNSNQNNHHPDFWVVVIQMVVLDTIFSIDAVITAIGMVNHLPVMIIAVVIAMGIMLLAAKPLTCFINANPTIIILCLSFLLIIGLSLVAESFGFHIPKGYLYASISFSIFIELFNQIARRNLLRHQARRPMRERAAEAILKLIDRRSSYYSQAESTSDITLVETIPQEKAFQDEECYMIKGVLTYSQHSIRNLMTPRNEISWVDVSRSINEIRIQLLDTPHSLFPVCRNNLDTIIGVVRAKELLVALEHGINIDSFAANSPAIMVLETLDPIKLLGVLRRAKGSFVIVTNDYGIVQGLITPLDVLESIAGEFPDADENEELSLKDDSWFS